MFRHNKILIGSKKAEVLFILFLSVFIFTLVSILRVNFRYLQGTKRIN
jgi:hypothetical protein